MKENKIFVISMIVTSVIGLTALMVFMFMGIKYFTKHKEVQDSGNKPIQEEVEQIQFSSTATGILENIGENTIDFYIFNRGEVLTLTYAGQTNIGRFKENDIVEIEYEPQEKQVIKVKRPANSWVKEDLEKVKWDRPNRKLWIGSKSYQYTGFTLVFNEQGETANIYQIGDYDKVSLKGVDDMVYRIEVTQKEGKIKLIDLPVEEGVLEIDINRQIPIQNLTEDGVGVVPGEHKVSVYLTGYEPLIYDISIAPGEEKKISLKDAQLKMGQLEIQISNPVESYQVKILEQTYNTGDVIELPEDEYKVSITAPGYKNWEGIIELKEQTVLQVELEPGVSESETSNNGVDDTQVQSDIYTINISTEPAGAKVYINEQYKGTTPYTNAMSLGDYNVRLEKEGYNTYTTSIIIDHSDMQNNYLYMLTPITN